VDFHPSAEEEALRREPSDRLDANLPRDFDRRAPAQQADFGRAAVHREVAARALAP